MKRIFTTLMLALACVAIMAACGDRSNVTPTPPEPVTLTYELTATTVTITPIDGYEYRINTGEWQDSNVFTELTPNTLYALYMRKKAADGGTPGATYYATVTLPKQTQGAVALATTVNATQIRVESVDGAEYRINDGAWQDEPLFVGLAAGTDYDVSIRLKETDRCYAGEITTETVTTLDKETIDVYIIAGQSNGLGISHVADVQLPASYPEVMIYYDGENGACNGKAAPRWDVVKPGQGLDSAFFGPEIGMSQVLRGFYNSAEGRRVAIIKYTWGGTSMWDWWLSPTTVAAGIGNPANVNFYKNATGDENCARLYFDLVNTVKNGIAALGSGYEINYRGMAWMQGEGDACAYEPATKYETILTNFINDFRTEIGAPELPVAIGRINTQIAGYEDIVIQAEKDVATKVPNCTFVDTSDLEQGLTDWWHFFAPDMIKLGNRFASALMEFHDFGDVGTLDEITLETGLGAMPRLPQYGWATTADGARRLVSLTWDEIDGEVLATTGEKTITGKAKNGEAELDLEATLTVRTGATVDGVLDDAVWQDVAAHEITLYQDIYANLSLPVYPVTATFRMATNEDGMFFAIDVRDPNIINNYSYDGFDLEMFKDDGIELYIDASGQTVNKLTDKSLWIWLTASDILRLYDSNADGTSIGINQYLAQNPKYDGIIREVKLHGTPNQDKDVDTGIVYEIFVPYEVFGVTDLSKYRFTLGIRSLAWLPNGYENPYGVLGQGKEFSTFNNSNIATWHTYESLLHPATAPALNYSVDGNTLTIERVPICEYSIEDGVWTDNNVFTDLDQTKIYTVAIRYKAIASLPAGAPVTEQFTLTKTSQTTPAIALRATATMITVSPVEGAEYRLEDGNWQDDNVFRNLTPDQTYTVYMRMKETSLLLAGDVREASITTNDNEMLDVYILAGQSNALGISSYAEIGLDESYPDIMMYYDGENGLASGAKPSVEWTTVALGQGSSAANFGPEIGMSQIFDSCYDAASGNRVAIIKYTWGGTAMWDWWLSPTSVAAGLGSTQWLNFYPDIQGDENCARLYFDLVNTVKNGLAALGDHYNVSLRGMAWMQGETDATNQVMAQNYETILTNFINDFRTEINAPELPVAIGRINTQIAGYEDIVIRAEKNVASEVSNCTFVDTSDLEQGFLDWWHFRARDMVKLGNRFASALMEFHNFGDIGTLDEITLETGLGATPRLPQYGWATAADGARRLVSLTWDEIDAEVLATAGEKTITGKAKNLTGAKPFEATLTVRTGATVDGVLDDAVWKTATLHTIEMSAQFPVTATFRTAAGDDGLYFAVEVTDQRINNNFTNQASFDWDICLNDGIELYVDASGSDVQALTAKSAAIWISASDILRIYDGHETGNYGDVNGANNNVYLTQDARFTGIVREVVIHGTPNQDADLDTGVTYEVFVPFSCFNETDLSKYRVTLGIRSLAWLPDQNPNFEVPFAALNVGAPTGGILNNGNIQSWYPYSQLL